MSLSSYLSRIVSKLRRGSARKKNPRRDHVSLEITVLEDRTLLSSNVLSYGGQDLSETVLTPANVSTATFGKAFTTALDGTIVRAQPLYVSGVSIPGQGTHNVVYVATTGGNLYAIDANGGQILWQDSFVNPSAGVTAVQGTDFGGAFAQYGIRGTPVIDASTGTIFVVTFTRVQSGTGPTAVYDYVYQLHDVSLTTGQDAIAPITIAEASEPVVDIPASVASWQANWSIISGPSVQGTGVGSVNGTITFNACAECDTAALTIADGNVYIAFSGLQADTSNQYHGWLLGYSTQTLQLNGVFNSTPNGSQGGIWMGGGPVAVDAAGNLYLAVGNGVFGATSLYGGNVGPNLNAAGFPADGNYGDSYVKLAIDPTSSASNENINGWGLKVVDYFAPQLSVAFALATIDGDTGSSPPVLIPNPDGTAADPDLLVGAGKAGIIYVMDPDNMGKYQANADDVLQEVQESTGYVNGTTYNPTGAEGQLAMAEYLNGTVYMTGNSQFASAYSLVDDQLTLTSQSTNKFGYAGADPTISANGSSNGIVWELDDGTKQLFAFSASNLGDELWASNQAANNRDALTGALSEFQAPTAANGMVYVVTEGYLNAYGLLATPPSAPTGLTATTVGTSQINLAWTNPSTTQNQIEIQRSLDGVNFTTIATISASLSAYQDTSVTANTTYYYQVVASNEEVASGPSNIYSATSAAAAGTAPLAPSGLMAVAAAAGPGLLPQVNLSWTDNNPGNETAFLIERSVNGGAYSLLEPVPATQTTYSDLNLAPGTYSYEVISSNAAGNSSPSASASAPVPTIPATPSQGQVTALSPTAVSLSWQEISSDETGFQIYRRAGVFGDYTLIATLPASSTTYQDTTVAPGTLYSYQIQAFNISGHFSFTGVTVTTPPQPAGTLEGADAVTQGSWKGVYGTDGYSIAGDTTSYPSYATVNMTGASLFTWANPSTDGRGLERATTSGAVAAAWNATTFTVNIDLTDGQAHDVALYLLDWDNEGRVEEVQLLNANTGAVLSTQTVSSFQNGEYLYWNIVGNVEFRFSTIQGTNAVLSGLFFGLAPAATLVGTDAMTQGNWQGTYGTDGYNIAGSTSSYPSYAQVNIDQGILTPFTYSTSSTDPRNLELANDSGRIAAAWNQQYGLSVNIDMLDNQSHVVTLYLLDWADNGLSEQITLVDPNTGDALFTQTVSNFSQGLYLSFDIRGNVQFNFSNLLAPNGDAVLSGIFFGAATPASSYLGSDAATQGSWKGTYGADGYDVIGGAASYPAYASVSAPGVPTFTWAASTTDPRALQSGGTSGQVAAALYGSSFTIDVDLLDGQSHGVALYLLDWENAGRSEQINVLNAATGSLLNSQTVSNFSGGVYLDWTLKGDIEFQITCLAGTNAVASGLFFGSATPAATYVTSDSATQGSWKGTYGVDGYDVAGDPASYPAYAQVNTAGVPIYTWAASTTDPRALQNGSTSGQVAAALYGSSFTIGVNLLDGQVHSVALYLLDWENAGRSEKISVLNAVTGAVLSSQTVSNFNGGVYEVFSVQGDVEFQFTCLAGTNAVVSGLFFGGAPAAATYLASDIATQGNWKGVYGADGYNVIGDSASYPAYASVRTAGAATFVWAASTTSPSALQRASASGQVAATWDGASFSVDINLLDGQSHEVALYLLDWNNANRRSETISVLNAETGAVLSSQTASDFSAGEYLVFNLRGNVIIQFTDVQGANAVLSGLFFGGPAPGASFVASNTVTAGNWQGTYGSDGYNVAGGSVSYPAYAHVSMSGASSYTWAASTTDPRALEQAGGNGRVAATWYSATSFTVNVSLLDSQSHVVTLYLLDWENAGRSERIDVLNAATGAVLTTETASSFTSGLYLTFDVTGDVDFRFTNLVAGSNAVLSGLFFGGSPASASFFAADTTTQGNWEGNYGADGYDIIGGPVSLPSYAQVTPAGNASYMWATSTTDARDLEIPGSSSRLAACWYGVTTFTVDIDLTDNNSHQVALYFLAWDGQSRTEQVQLVNPVTGAVLNTQTLSSFSGGEYLVWNMTGNVQVRITTLAGVNSVLSGIFFAPDPPAPGSAAVQQAASVPTAKTIVADTAVVQAAPAVANSMLVQAGSQQNAAVNKSYGQALQALVVNSSGKPVSGVTVTFTAPASGAGGTFGGKSTVTAVTAANGIATAPAFTANASAGNFSVLATINGASAAFSLTNLATAPAKAVVKAGTTQTATVGQAFGAALEVLVTDASGHAVSGAWVVFSVPASGASGTFNGSVAVQTNASGIATAPTLIANTVAGSFHATASVNGLSASVSFALTNNAGPPARVTTSKGTGQSVSRGSNFPTALAVLVTDAYGNPISGVAVTFTIQTTASTGAGGTFAGNKTTVTVTTSSQGVATAPALKANSSRGAFTITASIPDVLLDAVLTLTNL